MAESDGEKSGKDVQDPVSDVRKEGQDCQRIFCLEGINLPPDKKTENGHCSDADKKDYAAMEFFQKDVAQARYEPAQDKAENSLSFHRKKNNNRIRWKMQDEVIIIVYRSCFAVRIRTSERIGRSDYGPIGLSRYSRICHF